jgi:hypothetical protein
MVVMDIQGCSLTSLTGDLLSYLSQSGALQTDHYPNVLKRVFVVNCPFFVAGAWSMIKGIVPESVHVEILSSSSALEAMRKYINEDQIPTEYGGSSPYALGEHPYELALKGVVTKAGESDYTDVEAPTLVVEPIVDRSFSFNHNEQQRVYYEPKKDMKTEISSSDMIKPKKSSLISANVHPLRRRLSSRDESREDTLPLTDDFYVQNQPSGGDGGILLIVSIMYVSWCAVQAAIETTVPLWLLSPAILGGLGYAPSRSGMALFSTSIVLLWLTRTKVARVVSRIPSKDPMRAFRIAVGSEAALLALLPLVPSLVT